MLHPLMRLGNLKLDLTNSLPERKHLVPKRQYRVNRGNSAQLGILCNSIRVIFYLTSMGLMIDYNSWNQCPRIDMFRLIVE